VDSHLAGKPSIQPYFILKTGPPSSGKSTIMDTVYQDILQIKKNDVVEVSLDEFVEDLTSYNNELAQTLDRFDITNVDDLTDPRQIDAITSLYFKYRAEIEDHANLLLMQAILEHKHVSVETVGTNAGWWFKSLPKYKSHGYRIVIVYPWVRPAQLRMRLLARNAKQLRKVPWSRVETIARDAQATFSQLIPLADQALVLDNSEDNQRPAVLLDVVTNEIVCNEAKKCEPAVEMQEALQNHIQRLCDRCLRR
jgi:predicted ABC-type ATPase